MSKFVRKLPLILALGFAFGARVEAVPAIPSANMSAQSGQQSQFDPSYGNQFASLGATDSTAMRFVVQNGLHKNLSLMLLHDVKDSGLVQDAIRQYGMDKVQKVVVGAIRSAHKHHAHDWNTVMADAYASHFNATQLQSLLIEKDASPFFGQLVDMQSVIASDVQKSGAGIFAAARTEVMDRLAQDLPL